MTGHFTMFNHMLKTYDKTLSQTLIKEYHYYLKAGVFEDLANGYPVGEYKNRMNTVSDIETSLPACVEDDMQELLESYNAKENHTIEDIAIFHAKFEKIHPFQDGNGRVGRIIVFRECLKNRIAPVIIEDTRKAEYYECLNVAQQQGEYEKLLSFFKSEQEEYKKLMEGFIVPVSEVKPKKMKNMAPRI